MCIICAKVRGVKPPSEKTLRACFYNNPDGAGIAYLRHGGKAVVISKGFMTADSMIEAVKKIGVRREDSAIYHFRQATHGAKDAGNCHPFPLSSHVETLRSLSLSVPVAVAHNGIFGGMPEHNLLSDTQKFVCQVLADKSILNNLESVAVQELIKGYCGTSSKLAFLMVSRRPVMIIGKWEKAKGGLYFSNGGYRLPSVSSYGGYGSGYGSGSKRSAVASWRDKSDAEWEEEFKRNTPCDLCGSYRHVEYSERGECYACSDCTMYIDDVEAEEEIEASEIIIE